MFSFGRFPFSTTFDDFDDFDPFSSRRTRRNPTYKYYDILGVPQDASTAQIRKAFTKKAMQLHPDKGGDLEKFKEVNEAYEVLKDESKRRHYDQMGDEGMESGMVESEGYGTVDDLFNELMGMNRGRRSSRRTRPASSKGKDMVQEVQVTLEEIYNGSSKKFNFIRSGSCKECRGTGFKSGMKQSCGLCNGRGVKVSVMQYGPGYIQQVQTQCEKCGGSGLDSDPSHYCIACCGAGLKEEPKTLDIYIEQGMPDNHRIRYHGEASSSNPMIQPGDVIVVIKTLNHSRFRRQKADLLCSHKISLFESLCGVDFAFEHLDGRRLRIVASPGEIIRPGQVKCIEEEGMPVHGQPSLRGNLYIQFEVQYPDSISPAQQANLQSLFGYNRPRPMPGDRVDTRDVPRLSEELSYRSNFGRNPNSAYESDESEGIESSRQQVQCSQQ